MARRKGSIVALNADFSELDSAVGALNGMVATVRTDRFLVPLMEATHRRMTNSFNMFMDTYAAANPHKFHHVYEWRMTGNPAGRLWEHELKGRGSSNRLASWAWKPSKTPILTPQERANDPGDPMSYLTPEKVAKFSDRSYIFIWKAPVMEYDQEVEVRPKWAERIAFPSLFAPGSVIVRNSSLISNPGGDGTTLAFTEAWSTWWNTSAEADLESNVNQEIQAGIEAGVNAAVKKGKRKASLGMKTMTFETAKSQGFKWAEANLHRFASAYGGDYEDGDM